MNDLKLYFVVFVVNENKQWSGKAGYVFGRDRDSVNATLNEKYGLSIIRSIDEVDVKEGTILYGRSWNAI